jgi:capsule polysaccharide export protein KpsE/RkpR
LSLSTRPPTRELADGVRSNGEPETSLLMGEFETRQGFLPYLQLLWTNRRLLFKTGVYSVLVSTLIAFVIPTKYESTTRLMPPDSSGSGLSLLASLAGGGAGGGLGGGSGAGLGGLAGMAGDMLGMKNSGDLFIGVRGSENIEDALIENFQLKKVYHDSKIEDARKSLEKRTDISADRKSGIITISVTDHDPKRAAAMASAYVNELDRVVAQVSTSSARRERIFLEERLKAVKAELDGAAKTFGEFASNNSAIDISAQGKAMVEAAATLQGEMIAAQSELEGLRQTFTDDNVRVRSLKARIDELNSKLKEIGGAGGTVGGPADDALFPSIRRLPILGVTYADLYRQTKIDETVYELLTQQYELARVEEAKEIPTVKVLDSAIVPTKKSFPPRALIISLGTMLGITMAMLWIVAKTQWDLVEAGDPRKLFAVEVFTTMGAHLPRFSRNGTMAQSNGHQPQNLLKRPDEQSGEESAGQEHDTE